MPPTVRRPGPGIPSISGPRIVTPQINYSGLPSFLARQAAGGGVPQQDDQWQLPTPRPVQAGTEGLPAWMTNQIPQPAAPPTVATTRHTVRMPSAADRIQSDPTLRSQFMTNEVIKWGIGVVPGAQQFGMDFAPQTPDRTLEPGDVASVYAEYQRGRRAAEEESKYWDEYGKRAIEEIERINQLIAETAAQMGAAAAAQVSAAYAPRIQALEQEIGIAKQRKDAVNSAFAEYEAFAEPVWAGAEAAITAETEGLDLIEDIYGQTAGNIEAFQATITETVVAALPGLEGVEGAVEGAIAELAPQMEILAEMSAVGRANEEEMARAREAMAAAAIQYAGISDAQESRREQFVLNAQLQAAIESMQRDLAATRAEAAAAAAAARAQAEQAYYDSLPDDIFPSDAQGWGTRYANDRIASFTNLTEAERERLGTLFGLVMNGQAVSSSLYGMLQQFSEATGRGSLPKTGLIQTADEFGALVRALSDFQNLPEGQWAEMAAQYGWGEPIFGGVDGSRVVGYTRPQMDQKWLEQDVNYLVKVFNAYVNGYENGAPAPSAVGIPGGSPVSAAVSGSGWQFPVLGRNTFSDSFGVARSNRASGQHDSIDIYAKRGTSITVPVSGTVTSASRGNLGGLYVIFQGDDGFRYYFAHLNDRSGAPAGVRVRKGQRIGPGTVIGFVGDSGNARTTPPHLHFNMKKGGRYYNPYTLLRKSNPF